MKSGIDDVKFGTLGMCMSDIVSVHLFYLLILFDPCQTLLLKHASRVRALNRNRLKVQVMTCSI